jgi:hypothetical protein
MAYKTKEKLNVILEINKQKENLGMVSLDRIREFSSCYSTQHDSPFL